MEREIKYQEDFNVVEQNFKTKNEVLEFLRIMESTLKG